MGGFSHGTGATGRAWTVHAGLAGQASLDAGARRPWWHAGMARYGWKGRAWTIHRHGRECTERRDVSDGAVE